MTTQHRTFDTGPISDAPDHSPQQAAPLACPSCGAFDVPRVTPGTGPHTHRANCAHCGAFLRWLSRYTHEERVHRHEQFRRATMAHQFPSPKQLAYLLGLGYRGAMPSTRDAASQLIDALVWEEGGMV